MGHFLAKSNDLEFKFNAITTKYAELYKKSQNYANIFALVALNCRT